MCMHIRALHYTHLCHKDMLYTYVLFGVHVHAIRMYVIEHVGLHIGVCFEFISNGGGSDKAITVSFNLQERITSYWETGHTVLTFQSMCVQLDPECVSSSHSSPFFCSSPLHSGIMGGACV